MDKVEMGFRRDIDDLLKCHRWTRRMVIIHGNEECIETAFQEFPHYINRLIYHHLHLTEVLRLHKDHTYFRMQYDILQSEYLSKEISFSMRDDWRIESSFVYVIQYLYDLLEVTHADPDLQKFLKRRYRKYIQLQSQSQSFESEKNKESYNQSTHLDFL